MNPITCEELMPIKVLDSAEALQKLRSRRANLLRLEHAKQQGTAMAVHVCSEHSNTSYGLEDMRASWGCQKSPNKQSIISGEGGLLRQYTIWAPEGSVSAMSSKRVVTVVTTSSSEPIQITNHVETVNLLTLLDS